MSASRGFTLVEILTALVIAGIGAALAAGVFASGTQSVARTAREAERAEAVGARSQWMRETLTNVVGPRAGASLAGWPDSMRLRAYTWVAEGWMEPRSILITAMNGRMVADFSDRTLTLSDSVSGIALEYLADLGAAEVWLPRWTSVALPIAVRVQHLGTDGSADTTLYLIGLP